MRENGLKAKRAVEALRSGVPNRDAVRELGSNHPDIEAAFLDRLAASQKSERAGGLVVTGDFGSGKSHLLEYLQHMALERNYIASKVVISKETPLHDLGKVFRTAVDVARVPDRKGAALAEIVDALSDRHATPAYRAFSDWVNDPASGINDRFAAALYLYEQTLRELELRDRIVRFWGGDTITVTELRRELREIGEGATYLFPRVTEKELALQRFLFAARLIRAAGYAGWVLLLDEIELVGRYSLLQRALSYGEVTRWVEPREPSGIPGVAAVLTVSQDFYSAVIDDKGDHDQAPN
ncbi:MAG: BREX system ATP-binding domain-containing protein, partial [Longimicrobiales bacterium]